MPHSPAAASRILCSVDQTPLASAVAYAAAGFALQLGATIDLVRSDPRVRGTELQRLAAHGDLERLVDQAISGPTDRRVRTALTLSDEPPATLIRRVAAAAAPAMVVMGSRGRSRLRRHLFGSQSATLLRETTLPLVLVPPDGPEIFSLQADAAPYCHVGQILIPVDLGPATEAQVRFARQLLTSKRCHGVLLHVTRDTAETIHRPALDALREALGLDGDVSTLVRRGRPGPVIAEMLRHDDFGLVVLGRDQRRAGTLASELLRDSNALVAVAP